MNKSKRRRERRSKQPLVLIGLGAILIVVALLLLSWNPAAAPGTATTSPINQNVPFPDIARVSVKDAKAAYDIKNAVFLDVRGEEYYQQGHIPGAVSIPEDQLEIRMDELDKSAWIITYCT